MRVYTTTREINAFRHTTYTGARTPLTVSAGVRIRKVSFDNYDAIYGEPVFWFEIENYDGSWTQVGAINLPFKVKSWAVKAN